MRLDLQQALERVRVVLRVGLVDEVGRPLAHARVAVGVGERAARALHDWRLAVAGQSPASCQALDLVVADAGEDLVLDFGVTGLMAEDPERVAEHSNALGLILGA